MFDYSSETEYNKAILGEIKKSYDSEKIIPFIGSGFSKNANPKYPTWSDFIKKLSKEKWGNPFFLQEKFPGSEYLIRSADYYSASEFIDIFANTKSMRKERSLLKSYVFKQIEKHICSIPITDPKVHSLLLSLSKCNIYFTTNWDKVIEDVARSEGVDLKTVHDNTHLQNIVEYLADNNKVLIKMHGCVNHYKNIVISETDYYTLIHDVDHPINIKFKNELFHKDFLFLGFSFNDPNIINLSFPVHLIKKDFAPFTEPKIFMISFSDYDPILANFFIELRGIYILFLDVPTTKCDYSLKALFQYLESGVNTIINLIERTDTTINNELKQDVKGEIKKIEEKIKLYYNNHRFSYR